MRRADDVLVEILTAINVAETDEQIKKQLWLVGEFCKAIEAAILTSQSSETPMDILMLFYSALANVIRARDGALTEQVRTKLDNILLKPWFINLRTLTQASCANVFSSFIVDTIPTETSSVQAIPDIAWNTEEIAENCAKLDVIFTQLRELEKIAENFNQSFGLGFYDELANLETLTAALAIEKHKRWKSDPKRSLENVAAAAAKYYAQQPDLTREEKEQATITFTLSCNSFFNFLNVQILKNRTQIINTVKRAVNDAIETETASQTMLDNSMGALKSLISSNPDILLIKRFAEELKFLKNSMIPTERKITQYEAWQTASKDNPENSLEKIANDAAKHFETKSNLSFEKQQEAVINFTKACYRCFHDSITPDVNEKITKTAINALYTARIHKILSQEISVKLKVNPKDFVTEFLHQREKFPQKDDIVKNMLGKSDEEQFQLILQETEKNRRGPTSEAFLRTYYKLCATQLYDEASTTGLNPREIDSKLTQLDNDLHLSESPATKNAKKSPHSLLGVASKQTSYNTRKAEIAKLLEFKTPNHKKHEYVKELLELADALGVKRDLSGLDLSGADLRDLDLCNVDFRNTDLREVWFDITNTIDAQTDFRGVKFNDEFDDMRFKWTSLDGKNSVVTNIRINYIYQMQKRQISSDLELRKQTLRILSGHLKNKRGGITIDDLRVLLDTAERFNVNKDVILGSGVTLADPVVRHFPEPYAQGQLPDVSVLTVELYRKLLEKLIAHPSTSEDQRGKFRIRSGSQRFLPAPGSEEYEAQSKLAQTGLLGIFVVAHMHPRGYVKQIVDQTFFELSQPASEDVLTSQKVSAPQARFNNTIVDNIVFASDLINITGQPDTEKYTKMPDVDCAKLIRSDNKKILVHGTLTNYGESPDNDYFTKVGSRLLADDSVAKQSIDNAIEVKLAPLKVFEEKLQAYRDAKAVFETLQLPENKNILAVLDVTLKNLKERCDGYSRRRQALDDDPIREKIEIVDKKIESLEKKIDAAELALRAAELNLTNTKDAANVARNTAIEAGFNPPALDDLDDDFVDTVDGKRLEYQLRDYAKHATKTLATQKTIHIIPEVSEGIAANHICLRIITQKVDQTFSDAFKESDLFDPRFSPKHITDKHYHSLNTQNITDDINCGRYVAAMAIQAAGLAKDGLLPITADRLKASPAVKRALHYSSEDDAKTGLSNAYVRPLEDCKTYEEKMVHYGQVLSCLRSEYESRDKYTDRTFHGSTGQYNVTRLFKEKFGSATGLAYSAKDKLEAVKKIQISLASGGPLPKDLPDAANQGELKKYVQEIIALQEKNCANQKESAGIRPK